MLWPLATGVWLLACKRTAAGASPECTVMMGSRVSCGVLGCRGRGLLLVWFLGSSGDGGGGRESGGAQVAGVSELEYGGSGGELIPSAGGPQVAVLVTGSFFSGKSCWVCMCGRSL